MSLLMEALRKAEEAKRQGVGNVAADAPPPEAPPAEAATTAQALSALAADKIESPNAPIEFESLPSIDLPTPSSDALPKLPDNLGDLDIEFAPTPASTADSGKLNAIFDTPASPAALAPRLDAAPAPIEPPQPPRPQARLEPKLADSPQPAPASPSPAAPLTPATSTEQDQSAAQNLFQAKQTVEESKGSRKNFLVALGLFTLMAVVSIGIYFWLQLQPKNGLALTASNAPRPVSAPPVAPVVSPPPPVVTPAPPLPPPATAAAPTPPTPEPTPTASASRPQEEEVAVVRKESAKATPKTPPPDSPIRVTTSRLRLDPSLERGYDAFQKGDLAAARAAYEAALRNDPNSLDALNGLAMTQLRSGRADQAEPLFQRALEIDPRNGLAQASLASIRDTADPVQMESRLKTALADQPEAPHLHFALGNLYAKQSRWADAQQAYFRAMSGDPENPDYLFNLAVSLDRLHQIKLARQYYDQALAATAKRPAGFDRAPVEERLRKLQP